MQTIRYGPYGENANATGALTYSTANDPYLFQGGYHMPGSNAGAGNIPKGLLHYGARYYEPTSGRWTQQDSLPSCGTLFGLYLAFNDDPINQTDPGGDISKATCAAVAFLAFCSPRSGDEKFEAFPSRAAKEEEAYNQSHPEYYDEEPVEPDPLDLFELE